MNNSFIIEINSAFGMKIQEITGIDISGKIIEHIEKNYKKPNNIQNNISDQAVSKELEVDQDLIDAEYIRTHTMPENIAYMKAKGFGTTLRNFIR